METFNYLNNYSGHSFVKKEIAKNKDIETDSEGFSSLINNMDIRRIVLLKYYRFWYKFYRF